MELLWETIRTGSSTQKYEDAALRRAGFTEDEIKARRGDYYDPPVPDGETI